MRIHVADISEVGRNTMGVTVMDVGEGDQVATVDVIPAGTDDETDETDE